MNDISVPGIIGNKEISVKITFPHGSAGVGHIFIENWYQGQMVQQAELWHVYLNAKSILSPEDTEVLKAVILKQSKMERETIINSEIPYENGQVKVSIDHIIDTSDDESQYTGCYEATLGNGKIVKVEMAADGSWKETGGDSTPVAREIGKLIENYVE